MQVDNELRVPLSELQRGSGYTFTHLYRCLREGTVHGAVKVDGIWMIPATTAAEWKEKHCRKAMKHKPARRRRACPTQR